jgi:hypothetical protein
MRVISAVQYLAESVAQMRQEDYDGIMLVKAVKGSSINPKQYCSVNIGGKWIKIRDANKDDALRWFAEFASAQIAKLLPKKAYGLVPIPNSHVIQTSAPDFRTAQMARAIQNASGYPLVVSPSLRWSRVMQKSHEGGPRAAADLLPFLIWVGPKPEHEVILVDDVYTLGGHMQAAKWKLQATNINPVLGLSCGYTCHSQMDNVYAVQEAEV